MNHNYVNITGSASDGNLISEGTREISIEKKCKKQLLIETDQIIGSISS